MTELLEFDKLMEEKLNDFKCDVTAGMSTISGYVDGEESYINLMNELSALGYSYSTKASENYKPDENIWFSKNSGKNHRSPSVDAFGSPFSLIKTAYLDCTLGARYYRRSKENNYETDRPNRKKMKMLNGARPTKKLDCPAWMTIKSIKVYPDFISEKLSWRVKKKMTLELKNTLKASPPPRSFLRYYFKATTGLSHTHSTACMQLSQEIHPDLAKEIQRIVQNGTTSVREVKMLLEQYVEKLFADESKPKPARINKAFYPTDKVIYAHIYSARKSQVAQMVSSLPVQNYEYIIIDGEVTEIPQMIEIAEIRTVGEEIHSAPTTYEVSKVPEAEEAQNATATVVEVAEACEVNKEIQSVPATDEVAEIRQANREVDNIPATAEIANTLQINEEIENVPANCETTEMCQEKQVPVACEVTIIPQVNEKLYIVTEADSSVPGSLEKAQQKVRDKAKRIMDLSYHCNDVGVLTSIHLALSEQCAQMDHKVDVL